MAVKFFWGQIQTCGFNTKCRPLGCITLKKQNFSGTIAFKYQGIKVSGGVWICRGVMFSRLHRLLDIRLHENDDFVYWRMQHDFMALISWSRVNLSHRINVLEIDRWKSLRDKTTADITLRYFVITSVLHYSFATVNIYCHCTNLCFSVILKTKFLYLRNWLHFVIDVKCTLKTLVDFRLSHIDGNLLYCRCKIVYAMVIDRDAVAPLPHRKKITPFPLH